MTEAKLDQQSKISNETKIINAIDSLEYRAIVTAEAVEDIDARTRRIELSMLELTRQNSTPIWSKSDASIWSEGRVSLQYVQRSAVDLSNVPVEPALESESHSTVNLHQFLVAGSLISGATAITSLIMWLVGVSGILNPFVAFLALIASPFLYPMGKAAKA